MPNEIDEDRISLAFNISLRQPPPKKKSNNAKPISNKVAEALTNKNDK